MLPFHIRLGPLKLVSCRLISNFSKYYFKTGTICLLFSSSYAFTALEFDSNHFGALIWKIVKPRDHNEIKPPIGKILQKYKPIRHFVRPENNCRAHLQTKFTAIITRYSTFKIIQDAITWKSLFRRKSTFLNKLDLSEAITWQLFKSLSLRL